MTLSKISVATLCLRFSRMLGQDFRPPLAMPSRSFLPARGARGGEPWHAAVFLRQESPCISHCRTHLPARTRRPFPRRSARRDPFSAAKILRPASPSPLQPLRMAIALREMAHAAVPGLLATPGHELEGKRKRCQAARLDGSSHAPPRPGDCFRRRARGGRELDAAAICTRCAPLGRPPASRPGFAEVNTRTRPLRSTTTSNVATNELNCYTISARTSLEIATWVSTRSVALKSAERGSDGGDSAAMRARGSCSHDGKRSASAGTMAFVKGVSGTQTGRPGGHARRRRATGQDFGEKGHAQPVGGGVGAQEGRRERRH